MIFDVKRQPDCGCLFGSLVMRQTDDRADNDKALIASET